MFSVKRPASTDAKEAKAPKVVTTETILRHFPESSDGLKKTGWNLKPVNGGYYHLKNREVVVYYEPHCTYYRKFEVELDMPSLESPNSPFPMTDKNVILDRMRAIKHPSLLKQVSPHLKRINGHIYTKKGDVAVFFEPHNKFYTIGDIQTYDVLSAVHFLIQKMNSTYTPDRIIVLTEDGFTKYKPNGPVHPDFVYRVHCDTPNRFKFETGYGDVVPMTHCFKEYGIALEQGRMNSSRVASKLDESEHVPHWNKKNKQYHLSLRSKEGTNRYGNRSNHSKLKTIDGKVEFLVKGAISSQNYRSKKYPHIVLPLDHKKHKPYLTTVFSLLLTYAMASQNVEKLVELGIPIKPYHWSNDKLDDCKKSYIEKTSSGICDFSNISVTLKILNSSKQPRDGVLCNILNGNYFPISSIMKAALLQVKDNIDNKKMARYSNDKIGVVARKIADKIVHLANSAKAHQHIRIERGRPFKELDNSDVLLIKHNIINIFLQLNGRCYICGHPIGFLDQSDPDSEGRLLISLERHDNDKGYEEEGNITLIYNLFNTEMQSPRSQNDDETSFFSMKWTPALFKKVGHILLKDDFRVQVSDLSEEDRLSISNFEF